MSTQVRAQGPRFVRPGLFEVGMCVEGDPEARWHWHEFRAKSYAEADGKAPDAFLQLAHGCVGRLQESIRVRQLLVDDLLAQYPHAPYIKTGAGG